MKDILQRKLEQMERDNPSSNLHKQNIAKTILDRTKLTLRSHFKEITRKGDLYDRNQLMFNPPNARGIKKELLERVGESYKRTEYPILSPSAMKLRFYQTLNDIAEEKNSTIVLPFPEEILNLIKNSKKEK